MSKIEHKVCSKILERAEVGKAKYGVTMERDDLSVLEWLKHTQEELMDACVYIEKLIDEKKKEESEKGVEIQSVQEESVEGRGYSRCSDSQRLPKWVGTSSFGEFKG